MAVPKPKPTLDTDEPTAYELTVSDSGAVVLPPALCRQLDLRPGDEVVLTVEAGGRITVQKVQPSPPERDQAPESDQQPSRQPDEFGLRGLLRDYFTDWDDVNRFIEEERRGWAEREARFDEQWRNIQARGASSTASPETPSPPDDPSASTAPR